MSEEQNKTPKNQWTEDQQKAIELEGSDILVAAAAGSGKTAVLVERIIQKVIREDHPINVDELLVVTFTKASAQEMKERIGKALENQLQINPTSDHLRKQIALLNKASISTIHSFCTDVIRSNYYLINIDPNFRTADETEIKLLMDEVLEELLEEEYSDEANEVFFDLVSRYTSDRSDEELPQYMLKLYRHAVANPDPNAFLDQLLKNYEVEGKEIDELSFIQLLKQYLEEDVKAFQTSYEQALQIANSQDGPLKYIELLQEEYFFLEKLSRLSEMNWENIRNELQNFQFKRIATIKKGECDEQKKEMVKGYRDEVKKGVSDLLTKYFSRPSSIYIEQLRDIHPLLMKLVEMVKNFRLRFQQAKMEKGILDFNDLEHFALQILIGESVEGELFPSPVAKVYQEKFHEVLVDEYQDTNYVQESILKLIKSGEGSNGNLFMVGDVKQSIYRFRLAEPQLFISKYNTYQKEKNEETGLKIDLSKNFRSRAEVLDATNFIFKQIMGESLGGIDYDEDAMLKLGANYPLYDQCMTELVLLTKADIDQEIQEESESAEEVSGSLIEEKLEQIEARCDREERKYETSTI
jgi:ATP-dependent helicase/nuclease subunit A